jgi:hypothetical protein
MTSALAMLMLLWTSAEQSRGADEVASTAIDAFEAATKNIQSYDIVFKVEKHFVRGFDTKELMNARLHPELPMKPITLRLIDFPKPVDRITYWREVKSGPKFRIEQLEAPGGKVLETRVTDGVTARYLMPASGQGVVDEKQPTFAANEMDYECLYRNTYGGSSLAKILHHRAGSGLVRTTEKEDWTIEASAVLKPVAEDDWPVSSFVVTCDASHGMLPKRIECKSTPQQRIMTIAEFHHVGSNGWAPIRAKCRDFLSDDGNTLKFADETTVTVDVMRSRWNIDVPANEFALRFPPGILVSDRVRKLRYVAGSPVPPVNIKP